MGANGWKRGRALGCQGGNDGVGESRAGDKTRVPGVRVDGTVRKYRNYIFARMMHTLFLLFAKICIFIANYFETRS